MQMKAILALAGLAIALGATTALAQVGPPQVKNLTVQYSGVITNNVTDTLMIRQPDGTLTRYEGIVPNYAYKDAATGALLPAFVVFANEGSGGALLRGNATDLTLSAPTGINALGGSNSGNFSLGFKGSWNLPTYAAPQVPEPASIVIFAGGLAIPRRARRKSALQS
jgi:hypothetical protein